ncbi:hypothetical protein SAY86_020743 [Trapa natans]|uniref:U3 small nucleolar ribonucleoprotein protein MPP10 n=1 Tax=Trapa natans TaxID=22666 RepID=A0AAN7MSL7_TRANT|nr:hypothetical protein SAY86_020743 [Trapa natans]
MATPSEAAMEILHRLTSTEPPAWLTPEPSLNQETRTASVHLFSSIRPHCPKSPFEQLLIDGFDTEQIWQQIDLQTHNTISGLHREVARFNPDKIQRLFGESRNASRDEENISEKDSAGETEREDLDDLDDMNVDGFDKDEDSEEEIGKDKKNYEIEDSQESQSEEEEGDKEDGEEEGRNDGGIEDGFLKIKELEEYLKEDEAREYGLQDSLKDKRKEKKTSRNHLNESGEEDDEDDIDEAEDEESDELEALDFADEDTDKLARYEDFFGGKNKKKSKRAAKLIDESEELDTENEDDHNDGLAAKKQQNNLSTHEKELLVIQDKIGQMEKANLEPKIWTMQGEVTASTRPKNSALEVDLDFEHNARPAPVITEEVTASLEELIRKRILEGNYDDVQKRPALPTKAPREFKELDETKSKKGLAEIYEEEYAQKTNLVVPPLSFTDEQKKEASLLFKRLCLKLDALSHFNFAPKPVIEDMSIQANVPAFAMEEIAPMAVSDAAMLAPEEVFTGKGDIKDEAELTQQERKRRRANKKRKYKADSAKRAASKGSHAKIAEVE